MGKLSLAIKSTFSEVRSIVGTSHKLSVGDRIQANQGDETIITHSSHTWESSIPLPNLLEEHTMQIITFSKSYTDATGRCDNIFDNLRGATTPLTIGGLTGEIQWYPVSQSMYYTDSDDFACVVTVRCRISL